MTKIIYFDHRDWELIGLEPSRFDVIDESSSEMINLLHNLLESNHEIKIFRPQIKEFDDYKRPFHTIKTELEKELPYVDVLIAHPGVGGQKIISDYADNLPNLQVILISDVLNRKYDGFYEDYDREDIDNLHYRACQDYEGITSLLT